MKGKLNDQPLAELIREISSKGLSGSLKLEHERARTAVYFESGGVVFAASNIRSLRLPDYLSKHGLVSTGDLARLGNERSDISLGRELRAGGMISQKQLDDLLATVVTDVLRVSLLWTEGDWEFSERARLDDPVRVNVNTTNLLREAAHRLPLKFVSDRFRNPNESISRSPNVAHDQNMLPTESFILSRLDTSIRLDELVAVSGLSELDAYRVIYGLALSGLVKREYWHNAFRTDASIAGKEQTPASVLPQTPGKPPDPVESRWGVAPEEVDLESFLGRLKEATNHYQVMDVPLEADADEIKDAYYAIARRYHPDRFHLQSGTSLHARLSSAFARITQAYETLTDPNARSIYDASLERARQFAQASASKTDPLFAADDDDFEGPEGEFGQVEYNFREGFGALQQGRIKAAMTHLAAAARLAPHDARCRAYYGRALGAEEKTRRLAENEIQAAVKLEPSNATYRTMLAELYFELKFHRRAQTELERALALDPNNVSAQLLSRKLNKTRKAG